MTDTSLQDRLYRRLDTSPDGPALTYYSVDGVEEWITFGELFEEGSRAAHSLRGEGLRRGEVCVIVLPSGPEAVATIFGTLLIGAVPLLVAPPMVQGSLLDLPRVLRSTVSRAKARLVVCEEPLAEIRSDLEGEGEDARFLFGLPKSETARDGEIDRVSPSSTDVVAMQLTSGTTGFPRICVWDQQAMLAALDGMTEAMRLTDEDVCFNWTPLYHDMGLVNNFLLCLSTGVPLVLMSPHEFVKRPALWLRGLSETASTITWSPNFGYAVAAQRVRDRQIEGVRLERVRAFWNAAERIHYETIVAFHERFAEYGVALEALKTNFGCAENIGGATFTDIDGRYVVEHVDREMLYEQYKARAIEPGANGREAVSVVSAGQPHPTLGIEILSPDGDVLPEGHVGEVALLSPSRMRGYLDDPEATAQALQGDRLLTGDLGYLRGDDLFWVGRVKERITVRGKKLDPSDFEPVLFEIDGLREGCFVAFGVDDEKQGTQRIVVVSEVREPLSRSLDEISADIQREVFLRLGVSIGDILLVPPGTLAKTSSGKRRHRHFRQMYVRGELGQLALDSEDTAAA